METSERIVKRHLERLYELTTEEDFHNQHTPFEICDEMLGKIEGLNSGMEILVMFNLEFVYKLKEKFGRGGMENIWFLTPCEAKKEFAKSLGVNENHIRIYSYKDKRIIEEESMPKFDVVVGNPPYKKNLHLKFLELAYNSLKKDGKIVWIHPARWLQDPLAPMKKGSDFMKYKDLPFRDFKLISYWDANKLFGILFNSDLVISYLENGRISILDEEKIYELRGIPGSLSRILHKIKKSLKDVSEKEKINGIRVRIREIVPNIVHGDDILKKYKLLPKDGEIIINGLVNGKDWTENVQKNQFTKDRGSSIPLSIQFDTIEEAKNFIDSTNTDFYLFLNYLTKLDVNVQLKYLPFMDDYNEPWTNERFAEHFEISDDEMEFIKETIKKYKKL